MPRIVEDEGTRLFVVLTQGDDRSKRSSGQAIDKTSQRSTSSLLNDQTASSE